MIEKVINIKVENSRKTLFRNDIVREKILRVFVNIHATNRSVFAIHTVYLIDICHMFILKRHLFQCYTHFLI